MKPAEILIVEDDLHLLRIQSKALRSAGFEVIEARSGNDGLKLAREHRPELILADVRLPDIDEFEICKQIKTDTALAGCQLVFFSSIDKHSDHQAATLEAGADDYIARPISDRELVDRVRALLRLKESQDRTKNLARQQAVIAELGKRALQEPNLDTFFTKAVDLAAQTLGVEFCCVMEFSAQKDTLRLRAGFGWDQKLVGQLTVSLAPDAPADVLHTTDTFIIDDRNWNTPYLIPLLPAGHQPRGGILAAIPDKPKPFGFLAVFTSRPKRFTQTEADFLQAISHLLAAAIDCHRKELELQRQNQFLNTFLDTIPNPIFYQDTYGKYLGCNHSFADFIGLPPAQILGKTADNLISQDLADKNRHVDTTLYRQPVNQVYETIVRHSDGSQRDVIVNKATFSNSDGTVGGLVGSIVDITPRKQAEAALQESEERFRSTFEQAAVGLTHVSPAGRFLRVNQRFCEIVGYTRQEILALTFQDITHPDDLAADLRQARQLLAGEIQTYSMEKRYIRPDASLIWVNLTISLKRKSTGDPDYFISVVEEITERKRSEADLREAEQEIRQRNQELALLNQVISVSAASQETETILAGACRELAEAFNIPQATAGLLNLEKTEVIAVAEHRPEGRPSGLNKKTSVVMNNLLWQHLAHNKAPVVAQDAQQDPRLHPIRALLHQRGIASVLILPLIVDSQVIGGLALESTKPRHFSEEETRLAQRVADQLAGAVARARLAEAHQRLAAAIEQTAESIIITDRKGKIQYVNPAFERITGYRQTEVLGQKPNILDGGQLDAASHQNLLATITSGKVWQGLLTNKRKDGSLYTVEASISPIRDKRGVIASFVSTQRDVTRELQLEEQYYQAQKMDAIGQLTGGIAHDFNNLLTAINGYAELLETRLTHDNPNLELAKSILRAGQRAAALVGQLMAFSRKQTGHPEVLSLNVLIQEVSQMLQRIIGEDIILKTVFDADLWPVKIDRTQFEQVIINLSVNARDAMAQGGKLIIETSNEVLDAVYAAGHFQVKPGRYILLTISDTGTGMSHEVQSHIFEPFFTTKEKGKGTGLGLATVYGIVKQYDGHIRVYSEAGLGTTFKIYLPAVEAEISTSVQAAHNHDHIPDGHEVILVVEDEPNVRLLITNTLTMLGYTVLEAGNSQEALQLLLETGQEIQLLVTDLIMPGLNGKLLADKVTQAQPNVKTLLISGYADAVVAKHTAPAIERPFLRKPFSPTALALKVRELLDCKIA